MSKLLKFIKKILHNTLVRVFIIILMIWFFGSIFLYFAESKVNSKEFGSIGEAFWNMAIYLFNGMDKGPPVTITGRIIVIMILISSLVLVGVFTAKIASLFIEISMRGRFKMPSNELSNHIVICNWSHKVLKIITEVHNPVLKIKRPVVIISENTEDINFPDQDDDDIFNDVYLIKGDCANEQILKRANVNKAYSVIILADDQEGKYTDSKSILTILSLKNINENIYTIAEVANVKNLDHFKKAGVNEFISSTNLGIQLISQSAITHGITKFYDNLLTFSEETNEVYLADLPEKMIGKTFTEVSIELAEKRSVKPFIIVGLKRNDKIMINPEPEKFDTFRKDDKLLIVSYERPNLENF